MKDTVDEESAFNKISNLTVGDRIENESSGLIFYEMKTVYDFETYTDNLKAVNEMV